MLGATLQVTGVPWFCLLPAKQAQRKFLTIGMAGYSDFVCLHDHFKLNLQGKHTEAYFGGGTLGHAPPFGKKSTKIQNKNAYLTTFL